jgi:hypothetical protein
MVKEQYLTFKCQFLFTPSSPYSLIPLQRPKYIGKWVKKYIKVML